MFSGHVNTVSTLYNMQLGKMDGSQHISEGSEQDKFLYT